MHTTARYLVELVVPVAKEPCGRWPAPVTPETILESFAEACADLAQEERDGYEHERCCSAERKFETFRDESREQ